MLLVTHICRLNYCCDEELQSMLEHRNVNWKKQEIWGRLSYRQCWMANKETKSFISVCVSVLPCQLCDCKNCMHVWVCVCACRSTLRPGDNSDEWPRRVSNEALVTDWGRTLFASSAVNALCPVFHPACGGDWLKTKGHTEVYGVGRRRGDAFDALLPEGGGMSAQRKYGKLAKMQHLIYYIR